MAKLKVLRAGAEVQSLDLAGLSKPMLVVGRAENCDVRLDDRAVGREHAVIQLGTRGFSVQKKSKFGKLSVNGVEANESAFKPGDVISIADYQLRLEESTQAGGFSAASGAASGGMQQAPSGLLDLELSAPSAESTGQSSAGMPSAEVATAQLAMPPGGVQSIAVDDPVSESPSLSEMPLESPSDDGGTQAMEQPAADAAGFGEERTAILSQGALNVKLVFKEGDANVTEFEIKKPEISIGRGTNCDIILNDKKASRKHLTIRKAGLQFVAKDTGTANGSFVNGEKITEIELNSDDVLRIGDTEFSFKALSQDYFSQQQEFMAVPPEDPIAVTDAITQDLEPVAMDVNAVPMAQDPNAFPMAAAGAFDPNAMSGIQPHGGIPGLSGVAGIGVGGGPSKKETLLDKFKRQPLPRKILIVLVLFGVIYLALDEDPAPKKSVKKEESKSVDKVEVAYNALPPEKKQFIDNTYQLALDLYKNQQFERALFEAQKILDILPSGYKDTKDIKAYAEKAIEIEKSKAEERRRKEEEERIKKEVAELVAEAQVLVDKGEDAKAREVFSKVLERDPENPTVLRLSQLIEEREQQRKIEEENRRDREKRKKELEALLEEGRKLFAAGKYYEVMERMQDAPAIGYNDATLLGKAKTLIAKARQTLKDKTQPYLDKAQGAFAAGDYPVARDAYLSALKVDPRNAAAKEGLGKIREILHERAKKIYTDGIIAESVSDYATAKSKFRECLQQSMPDDVYRGRCERKSKRLKMLGAPQGGDPETAPGSADPQMPSLNAPPPPPPEAAAEEPVPVPSAETNTTLPSSGDSQ